MKMGEKVKKLRKIHGLTLDSLAEATNVSKSYLWNIENRTLNPSAKRLLAIANKLKTTISFLYDESKDKMTDSYTKKYLLEKLDRLSNDDKLRLDKLMSIVLVKNIEDE